MNTFEDRLSSSKRLLQFYWEVAKLLNIFSGSVRHEDHMRVVDIMTQKHLKTKTTNPYIFNFSGSKYSATWMTITLTDKLY